MAASLVLIGSPNSERLWVLLGRTSTMLSGEGLCYPEPNGWGTMRENGRSESRLNAKMLIRNPPARAHSAGLWARKPDFRRSGRAAQPGRAGGRSWRGFLT